MLTRSDTNLSFPTPSPISSFLSYACLKKNKKNTCVSSIHTPVLSQFYGCFFPPKSASVHNILLLPLPAKIYPVTDATFATSATFPFTLPHNW